MLFLDLTASLNILSRFWKRQLVVAKDARRVDNLCSRIYLSHRLLDGTTRFKELHQIVEDAKAKLESEVGPLDGTSSKMARGIVGRLPVAADVQKLCSLAIEKADEWLSSNIQSEAKQNGKLFQSCKVYIFQFHSAIGKFDKPSVILFALQIHSHLPAGLNLKILQLHLWCWFSRKLFPRSIILSKAINSGTGIAEKRLTQGSLLFSPKTKEGFLYPICSPAQSIPSVLFHLLRMVNWAILNQRSLPRVWKLFIRTQSTEQKVAHPLPRELVRDKMLGH